MDPVVCPARPNLVALDVGLGTGGGLEPTDAFLEGRFAVPWRGPDGHLYMLGAVNSLAIQRRR